MLTLTGLLSHQGTACAQGTVMLINSYHTGFEWVDQYTQALKKEVGDVASVISFDMDTKRLPDTQFEERAKAALQRLDMLQPDVVVTGDDNALRLLADGILNRGYPLVYLGVNENPRLYIESSKGATGVLERPLHKRSIMFLRDIFGKRFKHALVLFEVGTTSTLIQEEMFGGRETARFGDVQMTIHRTNNWEEWKRVVLSAKEDGYDVLVLGLHHRIKDVDGRTVEHQEALRWTCKNTPIPPIGTWVFNIGSDLAIGGLVTAPEPQGQNAGQMVKAILRGTPINSIPPVVATQGDFLFSRSRLRQWNIELPESIESEASFVH